VEEKDYYSFLNILGEIVHKAVLIVHAFSLLPNHIHILGETPYGSLSKWMQILFGRYAELFNRRHDRVGHLWQGRYKALLVDEGEYFLNCSRYIHLNPARAQLAPAVEYPWSSYGCYCGQSCPVDWVHTERTLRYANGVEAYRVFVESSIDAMDPWINARAGIIYGGKDFEERIKHRLRNTSHKQSSAVLQALMRTQRQPTAAEVQRATEKMFADSTACQRGMMVAYALHSFALVNIEQIADVVNRTPSAVSHAIRTITRRLNDDPELAKKIATVKGTLGLRSTL
jgi:putative transposase